MDQTHGYDAEESDQPAAGVDRVSRNTQTRRTFLRRSAAVTGAALLVACGGPPSGQESAEQSAAVVEADESAAAPAPSTATSSAEAAGSTPAGSTPAGSSAEAATGARPVGGTYRILSSTDIASLDPPGAFGSEDWWSVGLILYNQLYSYDKDGNYQADLAADQPTVSDDGLTYTIPLRGGVKFHNGRVMVADDVKFSLERQLWPEVSSWGKTYMSNVVGYDEVIDGTTKELSGIALDGPSTVVITLKQPQAVFPALLSMSMNGIIPKQETLDAGADWGSKVVIGTGPFKFVSWEAGQKATYERNPEYFKPGLPYLERIELNLNVEPSLQMLRFESGEAELIRQVPVADRERIAADAVLQSQLRTMPLMGVNRLVIHHKVKPFDDLRVRQAIAMAVDKTAFSQSSGAIPLEGFYTIPMLQYDEGFRSEYQYNPDLAKQLLADAGYPDGIKGITAAVDEGIQADLLAIGIEVTLQAEGVEGTRDQVREGKIPLYLSPWIASFPDAYDYVSGWTICDAGPNGYNDGMYCNTEVDELLKQAELLPLQDRQRLAAYRQIEDIVINKDVAFVGLINDQGQVLVSGKVKDDFQSFIYANWPYLETAYLEPS